MLIELGEEDGDAEDVGGFMGRLEGRIREYRGSGGF